MKNKHILTGLILIITFVCGYGQTADFSADTVIGCQSLTVQFTDLSIDAVSWEWDFNNDGITDSQIQNPSFTYTEGGQYSVTLRINNSISNTKTNLITVLDVDPIYWFKDTLSLSSLTYVFRNSVQIGEPSVDYLRYWTFGDNTTATGRTVVHQFQDTGRYEVNLTLTPIDLPGCMATTSRVIQIRNKIYVPNVFTPNGDAINDYFIVEYNGINKLNFNVYSRLGNLVYKSVAPLIAWDGVNLSGNEVSPGVYFYVLTSEDGEIDTSGFIHVFR